MSTAGSAHDDIGTSGPEPIDVTPKDVMAHRQLYGSE